MTEFEATQPGLTLRSSRLCGVLVSKAGVWEAAWDAPGMRQAALGGVLRDR